MADFNGSNTPPDIRDLWMTPPAFYTCLDAEFHFVADVAASDVAHMHERYVTKEQDALGEGVNWGELFEPGYVWCNPPYSNITPWVHQAKLAQLNGIGVVMLVPADTSVGWFIKALDSVTEVRFITGGRLSFIRADTNQPVNGNNKGSMLLIWNLVRVGSHPVTSYADRDLMLGYGRQLLEVRRAA